MSLRPNEPKPGTSKQGLAGGVSAAHEESGSCRAAPRGLALNKLPKLLDI